MCSKNLFNYTTDASFLRGEHVEENSVISREQLSIPQITK